MTVATAVKNIVGFLIDTLVGTVIEAIIAPVTITLSVVKLGSAFLL